MGKLIKYSLFVVVLITVLLIANAVRKACNDEKIEVSPLKAIYEWTRKGIQAIKAKKDEAQPVAAEPVAGE